MRALGPPWITQCKKTLSSFALRGTGCSSDILYKSGSCSVCNFEIFVSYINYFQTCLRTRICSKFLGYSGTFHGFAKVWKTSKKKRVIIRITITSRTMKCMIGWVSTSRGSVIRQTCRRASGAQFTYVMRRKPHPLAWRIKELNLLCSK